MRQCYIVLMSVGIALPGIVWADGTISAPPPAPRSDLQFSSYVEGSYNYLANSNRFTSNTYNRLFDIEPNGFTLQQAAMTLSDQPKAGVGGLINLVAGRDANATAAYGWDPYFGSQTLAFDPMQVYAQYAVGSFVMIAGKFDTLAGVEQVDPTQDANFSGSLLNTYAQPFTSMGVRGTYAVNDKLNLIAGLNNGWDSIRDISRRKTVELGTTYNPNATVSLATSFYSGGQRATDKTATGSESIRNLLDIIATVNATDKLALVANYDYSNQTLSTLPSGNVAGATWQGIAAYANYKFNDRWHTSVRGEVFDDVNGYRTGVTQVLKEITLTVAYAPIKSIELRAETRHDFANTNSFRGSNNVGTSNYQQSYALEGIYKFPA